MKKSMIYKIFVSLTVIVTMSVFFCADIALAVPQTSDFASDEENALARAQSILDENTVPSLWNSFADDLKESFFGYFRTFATLLFVTFMLGVIKVLTDNGAAMYAVEAVLCLISFSVVSGICKNVISLMDSLKTFMMSMLPVMTALYTSSGAVATASMSYGTTMVMLNVCSMLFTSVLLPSVKCILVFSAVTLISKYFDFSGFAKTVKSIVSWLFGLSMCIMSAVVYFQSVIGVSKDGLTSRAVRYAASSMIPVIGNVVSESARTISESMKLVRSVSGVGGIFAIIGIISAPIAAMCICKFFMNICSSLASLFDYRRVSGYFVELCGTLNLMLGACIGVSMVLILVLGIFAKVTLQV